MKKGRHPGLDARWGRRNRKLSRYRRSILMICAVLVCMTVMLAVGSMRLQAKNAQYKAQEAELQEQIREQEDRAKEIDEFEEYVDLVQIGARNMQNFQLLKAVGKMSKPILLKRGLANTIEEWIMSAEYIMAAGNPNVIFCQCCRQQDMVQHQDRSHTSFPYRDDF